MIYVDYGNAEWIPFDRFASLEEKYWTLQPQGVLFRLAGMNDDDDSNDGDFNSYDSDGDSDRPLVPIATGSVVQPSKYE